jgi:hypothetical protein
MMGVNGFKLMDSVLVICGSWCIDTMNGLDVTSMLMLGMAFQLPIWEFIIAGKI